MSDEQNESDNEMMVRDMAVLEKHALELMEHFDSVQVVVTRQTRDGTVMAHRGKGNWFARIGAIREWLMKADERSKLEVHRERETDADADDQEP